MKNNLLKIGVLGILVLTVLISGCTSSSTLKTFSDGVMSFNYPGDFRNYTNEINFSSSATQRICKLNRYVFVIYVLKNRNWTSPPEVISKIASGVKDKSDAEALFITTETNPNGVAVERITYIQDSKLGPILKIVYHDMYFQVDGIVYAISVNGPELFKQQVTDIANFIFQSIK